MDYKEKASDLIEKFGEDFSLDVVEEILNNNEACSSRYKTNYDRVCVREYWLNVRKLIIKEIDYD